MRYIIDIFQLRLKWSYVFIQSRDHMQVFLRKQCKRSVPFYNLVRQRDIEEVAAMRRDQKLGTKILVSVN